MITKYQEIIANNLFLIVVIAFICILLASSSRLLKKIFKSILIFYEILFLLYLMYNGNTINIPIAYYFIEEFLMNSYYILSDITYYFNNFILTNNRLLMLLVSYAFYLLAHSSLADYISLVNNSTIISNINEIKIKLTDIINYIYDKQIKQKYVHKKLSVVLRC